MSIEGEFLFLRAVGEFLKEGGGEDRRVWRVLLLNLKEQLWMRSVREDADGKKLRMMVVGSSQMKRMAEEMVLRNENEVEMSSCERIEGEQMAEKMAETLRRVEQRKEDLDVILVGGPSNSLVSHGTKGERGFGGERTVKVTRKENGQEEWEVRYHMTDQVKITMTQKRELVDRMTGFMEELNRVAGDGVRVVWVTIFPRFVKTCCKNHMTDEDVWLLDGVRRDVNREIKDGLAEQGQKVEVVEWWRLLGRDEDTTVTEIRKADWLDGDNVHLKSKMNSMAAEILCNRLLG